VSRVFVAGASGVIGRALVPILVAAGHEVTAMTRFPERGPALTALGATPAIVDAFDRPRLSEAVQLSRAEVVIHQLSDLTTPPGVPLGPEVLERNARLREEGTANLVEAVAAAGAGRIVAQSLAWLYAPGPQPHDEMDPLRALDPDGGPASLRGVLVLERLVLEDPRFTGIVLRYGRLYGPDTWDATPPEPPTVAVAAAARAAALAVDRGDAGVYNVVDDDGPVSNVRARADLGWTP